jgi:DNA (cytosine-5)-methyltransferase 1
MRKTPTISSPSYEAVCARAREIVESRKGTFAGQKFASSLPGRPRGDALSEGFGVVSRMEEAISKDVPWVRGEGEAFVSHWMAGIEFYKKRAGGDRGRLWKLVLGERRPQTQQSYRFCFSDLFCGIGGFRLGAEKCGGRAVFSCDRDAQARLTYHTNHGEIPYGDIGKFTRVRGWRRQVERHIPDHDLLVAGFPCQSFSISGVSARKHLGGAHGFDCKAQGGLFFDIVKIASVKRPEVILLENVPNIVFHNNGDTMATIKKEIERRLGYSFCYRVISSESLVAQRRARCYMVCLRDSRASFQFPEIQGEPVALETVLEESPPEQYTISDTLWAGHQRRAIANERRGAGFGARVAKLDKPAGTLVARYGKDGKECLIPQDGKNPRMLTPRECARLQGFSEEFEIPVSRTAAYRQFGNSVVVPLVEKIIQQLQKSGFLGGVQ